MALGPVEAAGTVDAQTAPTAPWKTLRVFHELPQGILSTKSSTDRFNHPQILLRSPLSHHNNVPELIARMSQINRYHTQLFSQYLAKLRAAPDGDGSLLDHMTILYGSGISNSTMHAGNNLPLLLVGGGAGRLAGGRHLTYSDEPPMANLLLTLMDKLDVPVERIGGSTGRLPIDTLSGV